MSSLTVLSAARRSCLGKRSTWWALLANVNDNHPIEVIHSDVVTPIFAPWNIARQKWYCSSSNPDKDSCVGDKGGAESRTGIPTGSAGSGSLPGATNPSAFENTHIHRCQRSRQREEAFREKLGYTLFKQGGVNLWRRARREAKNFEETKKLVQARVEQSKVKVKELRENIFTIPNLLTTIRLALSPYIGYLVINEQYLLGSSLFALAGATDLLDGWIARNFKNQQSVLGSIIDPLADKCLISILTITLTYSDLIPIPLTALIILRDIGLMSAAFYLRYQSLPPPITLRRYFDLTHATVQMKPTFISKVNTAVQLSLVGFSILAPVLHFTDHPYLHGLWYVTATTTVLSGLSYCFRRDVFKYLTKGR